MFDRALQLSQEQSCRFFDIVNGFLIDAVAHWCVVQGPHPYAALTDVVHLAEIIRPHL